MKKLKTIWIKGVIFSLIPAFFVLLGQSDLLLNLQSKQYIGSNVNIQELKDNLAIIGVMFTFLFLTCPLIISECNESKYHSQRDRLIRNNKNTFLSVLSKTFGRDRCEVDIRIFVPNNNWIEKLLRRFDKKRPLYFKIKNLDVLADPGITEKLKFEVYPKQEGLVGKCYQERNIFYDDDLENSNNSKYNLNEYQISKTSDLKFILVCPIMGVKNNVEAIVSFDSKSKITVKEDSKKQLSTVVLNYTQELFELVPEFFK